VYNLPIATIVRANLVPDWAAEFAASGGGEGGHQPPEPEREGAREHPMVTARPGATRPLRPMRQTGVRHERRDEPESGHRSGFERQEYRAQDPGRSLESAILTAAKRAFGEEREMEAKFNDATGRVDLFQIIIVADPVSTPAKEISLDEAKQFNLQADVGDELLFQIFFGREGSGAGRGTRRQVRGLAQAQPGLEDLRSLRRRKPPSRSSCSGCAKPNATMCSTSTAKRRAS